jgi:choline dehydrogenase-like flavoprotein
MNDIVASVDAPQRGAGESKSEQVPRRLSGKHKPRVVIVGGGFAGIAAAKSLRGGDADVTLIDRRNHHIFQPLLYQVATALLAPSEAAPPIANCAPETFGYQLPYAPRESISQRHSRGECRLLKDISNMPKVRSVENIGARACP